MDNSEFGSSEAASLGGKARAESLSKEERSAIARRAVEARWAKQGKASAAPVAKYGSSDRPLRIGETEIPCYVLNDGRRVITLRGFLGALGMKKGGGDKGEEGNRLARFAAGKSMSPFVSGDLARVMSNPIRFQLPEGHIWTKGSGEGWAYGYEATVLADLCEAVLQARDAGKLMHHQLHIVARSEVLVRAFARVGIVALVDEATGYQYARPQRDLEEQLKRFLSEGLVRYVSGFPHDYLKHLCRLRGVELRTDMRLPKYFGILTGNLVYKRIAPGLLQALKERRAERGRRSNKLYQWTSEDVGYPALMLHLGTVVGLMKIHTDYNAFVNQLDTVAPQYPSVPGLFDKVEDWEIPALR